MKKYNNVDWELLRDKLQGCETVAGYLAENMPGLTIQDLQERLENLRDLIQDARQFFGERVETPENTTVKNAKENLQKVLAFLENRPESEQVKITLHIEQAI